MADRDYVYTVLTYGTDTPKLYSTPVHKILAQTVSVKPDIASRHHRRLTLAECSFDPITAWDRYKRDQQALAAKLAKQIANIEQAVAIANQELAQLTAEVGQ